MSCGRAAAAAIAAALVLAAAAGCATTEQMNTAPQSSASTSTANASLKTAEENAVTQLQAWLADPQAGTLNYNTVQVTGGGTMNVMSILTGTFEPTLGQASLTGSVQTLGSGSTTQGKSNAIETDGKAYTTLPQSLQTGDRLGKLWQSAPVQATWDKDAAHSGWWTALDSVRSLTADGVTSLDGTTVDLYSETVDLSTVKGVPKTLLESDPVKKAGTTKIEVDVYTEMGSGVLVRVTYKLGLPVQIDAAATAASSAGYQVDMSGFAQQSATGSPTASPQPTAPDPTIVATETGDVDLAALLPF
ncbi:MAG TPA: hypothetical protein VH372_21000 [Actinospica sp.]|nr:hypothetical protein [Actinospica sp.]